MNILIVHCHPEKQSFNASLTNTAEKTLTKQGHNVEISDLYAINFDPVEKAIHYKNRVNTSKFDVLSEQRNAYKTDTLAKDVKEQIEKIKKCDLLILQFPLWWHQQPAMLKGWFDRVFVAGGLYTSKMRYDKGYFKGKKAICSVTSGAPLSTFTKNGRGGGEIETILRSITFSLHYMGFTVYPTFLSTEIQNKDFTYKSEEQFKIDLEENLKAWSSHLKNLHKIEPLKFYGWKDWDEKGNEKRD